MEAVYCVCVVCVCILIGRSLYDVVDVDCDIALLHIRVCYYVCSHHSEFHTSGRIMIF